MGEPPLGGVTKFTAPFSGVLNKIQRWISRNKLDTLLEHFTMAEPSKSAFRDVKHIPPRYTDEPSVAGSSSSAIPLFTHLNDADEEDMRDPNEVLPGYRDEESEDNAPPPFTVYQPVVKKIKSVFGIGDTVTVSHDQHLNNDGEALYRYI